MVTVGTVIVLALYALLDTFISLLFNGAMWIARSIMDSSITLFSENQNIISTFANLLPFSGGTEETTIHIGSIIDGISYGIITLVIVVGIIRSIAAPITGEEVDNPVNVCARAVIAIVAKHAIFGFGENFLGWTFNGLLGVFGRWFGLILSTLGAFNYEKFTDINAWTLNAAAYIGALILMATLLGSVLGAAISYIERILSFALTILVGPVAISLYAYKDTAHIARQWVMSIFTQFGAILLNLLLWSAFINQINSIEGLWTTSEGVGTLVFKLAIAIALLSLVKNCEKIFNSFGLSTLSNQDSARAITGGIAAIGSGALMAVRSAPMAKAAVERGMHGKNPAQGGMGGISRGASFAGGRNYTPFTGNTLYDKKGNLNSKGEGIASSNAARGIIARSAGNYSSPVFGSDSTRAAQNRQFAAQSALSNAISDAALMARQDGKVGANGQIQSAAGMRIGGSQIADSVAGNKDIAKGIKSDAPSYSGIQLANMAISGQGNGLSGGFRFTPSTKTPMGSAVSDASLNSSSYGAFNGAYKDAGGKEISSGLTIGTAIAPSGANVSGVIGQGMYTGPDGLQKDLGACFMPITGGGEGNLLGIGQEVCVGYDNNGYEQNMFVGDAISIGDDGAYAYRLTSPSAPEHVVISNEDPIAVKLDSSDIGFENLFDDNEPISQGEDFTELGTENLGDNDMFDPEEEGRYSEDD